MKDTHRAHILIPTELVQEIDALVGPRGRSAFLLETAKQEVQRRKLLRFLEREDLSWQADAHPELAGGAASWVHELRQQNERHAGAKATGRLPRQRKPLPVPARQRSARSRRSK